MDDNTSIQFRLRLAQINGINMNEKQLSETNHQRIDESIDHIKQALDRGNVAVRRNAVSHRLATPEHITQALNDKESYVRAAAINHHSATPEHITQALKDKEPAVRLLAIKHPKATPEHITQALNDKDVDVRQAALKHPNVTSEHITQALKDTNADVRYDAITHRKATTAHLEQGMKDSNESVRRAANIIHERDQQPITESHINEAKGHVSTEIDYAGDASDRAEDAKTHGVKITPSRNAVQGSDHRVSGPRKNVGNFLIHHYGDKAEAKENHPEVFEGMNEEKIDEVKRSSDYLHSTATEDQRAPTLKTYHTAMAKYSDLPPRAAHIKALNDTIDKHGVKNANQHVTKHFYSQMQQHLSDED